MKILQIFAILGVIAVVTAAGVALGGNITGHSIFGGDSPDSVSDYSQSGLGGGNTLPSAAESQDNPNDLFINDAITNDTIIEEKFIVVKKGGGNSLSCSQNILITLLTNWTNILCLTTDLMNQTRNVTEYDTNNCGTFIDINVTQYKQNETCDFCNPIWTVHNTTCNGTEVTEYYVDSNSCYSQTSLASDDAPANVSYACSPEVCDFIDNDLDGEVDEIGCANIYGIVTDTDNNTPIEGANISFYDKSVYDVYNETYGNYLLLIPKIIPDAVTDVNGLYNVSILEGDYHMVIQSSDEIDFNVKADKSKGPLKHDIEIDEDRGDHNFNAEGHILYSGEYEHSDENLYVCGDVMKFMMFGVNNGDDNETITFVVQDHTVSGNPQTSPIVYNGSINNSNESLTILARDKTHKIFDFEIPCSYNTGRHDIHVIWDDEKFHKIGNFFIEADITNPMINLFENTEEGYVNESIAIGYKAWDVPQDGTIGALRLGILDNSSSDLLTITIDQDINVDADNDSIQAGDAYYITYNVSGSYTARFTVTDASNNTVSEDIEIKIFITEEEANATAYGLYDLFGLLSPIFFQYNYQDELDGVNISWDRYNFQYYVGDEYMTPGNEMTNEEYVDLTVNADPYNCAEAPHVIPIPGSSLEEYNQTLYNFLDHAINVC